MDKNYLKELIFKRYNIVIVKGALFINRRSLEDRLEN